MKNKIMIFVFFLLALTMLSSCNKDEDTIKTSISPGTPTTPYLYVGPGVEKIEGNEVKNPPIYALNRGGESKVVVSTNRKWKSEIQGDWLTISQTEGGWDGVLGEGLETVVTITFAPNPSQEERVGYITFSIEEKEPVKITIKQTDTYFTNPIGGVPDPWIVQYGETYYLCKANGDGIAISASNKLTELKSTTTVWNAPKDASGMKPWNTSHVWAPELHNIGGRWYIYYTAGRPADEAGGSYKYQRSGVLRAKTSNPMGEWEDMGMLYTGDSYSDGVVSTVNNTSYAIDLAPFELNGKLYAVWSGGYGVTDSEQCIYIAEMSDPYTISSNRVRISRADRPWEQITTSRINEGPAILVRNNKVFVVYSANPSWSKYYCLGYLQLDQTKDPMIASNWTKSDSAVFYRDDNTSDKDGVNGVGHCSFTKSADGKEDWIVFHVKNRNDSGYTSGRSTFVQKFTWNEDGTPNFGIPVGWGEAVLAPSGQK